jgi:hypothetical protein
LTKAKPHAIIKKNKKEVESMKVNFNEVNAVKVGEIFAGRTFIADRKSCNERGLYLKVDKNSGLIKRDYDDVFAVNLETGQLRRFSHDYLVEKVEAEVFLKK